MFVFRKLADYSDGSPRVVRFDTMTGERYLADPETGAAKPWPLLGVTLATTYGGNGRPPTLDKIPQDVVARAINEGWASWKGHRVVHKSGGPSDDEWLVTHTFHEADQIVFHLLMPDDSQFGDAEAWVKKDLNYNVVGQPGKHPDEGEPSGFRVDWTFTLELANVTDGWQV